MQIFELTLTTMIAINKFRNTHQIPGLEPESYEQMLHNYFDQWFKSDLKFTWR